MEIDDTDRGKEKMIILMFLCCYFAVKTKRIKLIESWCAAVIVFVALAYLSLEILSVFGMVTRTALLLFWVAVFVVLVILSFFQIKKQKGSLKTLIIRLLDVIKRYKIWYILVAALLFLAVYTVPYNWDSMTYHLSRIANWTQNRSVAHYATHNIREIVSPVLAEFMNLHVYILSGESDVFFNLLQCVSALTNVWLVYEIAQKLGCARKYAGLAAFICFTAPSAFGEALSTQVDQFAAVWLLVFAYYYLELLKQKLKFSRRVMECCAMMAACIGFGYLAKPSVLIGMAVFLLVLFVICIMRKAKISFLAGAAGCSGVIAIVIVLPEMVRNLLSFGFVTLPVAGQRQIVGTWNPLYVFVNGLKNLAFNLPSIYLYESDHWIAAAVYRIAGILRVNIDDPSIAEDGRAFYLHSAQTYDPDLAVNPVILWGFLFCMLWGIVSYRRQGKGEGRFYSGLVTVTFLLFCCVVRWEPFVSRYMVAYLALLCPMIAYEIQDFTEHFKGRIRSAAPYVLLAGMCCVELIGLGVYHTRIAIAGQEDRFRGYFYARQSIYEDYRSVCGEVIGRGYTKVGLFLQQDSYEYPIWQALEGHVGEIRHVLVENESAVYEVEGFTPDVILSATDNGDELEYNLATYYKSGAVGGTGGLWLYEKE